MPFPDYERVVYQKNPLNEVVFRANYPKLLMIETELPSSFQKRVIDEYPIYEQRSVIQIVMATGAEGLPTPTEVPGRIHIFVSADRIWTVQLSSDSISLLTRRYVRWEEFKERLNKILIAFFTEYRIPILLRIGLRYQDLIQPERVGLAGRPWRELLQPHIAGEFHSGALVDADITARQTWLNINLENGDKCNLRHGTVTHKDTQRSAYLIDSDFYNQEQRKADQDGTLAIADRLHFNSGRLFRWCITETLHVAMEPVAVA